MIWQACNGEQHITSLSGTLFRLVESQEQAATLSLVDTLQEQALLEQLLEQTKPPVPPAAEGLHYLLKTPFRYPPLKWGSRFGSVYEPGIFYAGCSVAVTLAESAYYRMIFWQSMPTPAPKPILRTAHTLFSVSYQTERGIALHQPPFSQHQALLTSKTDYQHTQQLGSAMRSAGVDAFVLRPVQRGLEKAQGAEQLAGLHIGITQQTGQLCLVQIAQAAVALQVQVLQQKVADVLIAAVHLQAKSLRVRGGLVGGVGGRRCSVLRQGQSG